MTLYIFFPSPIITRYLQDNKFQTVTALLTFAGDGDMGLFVAEGLEVYVTQIDKKI